jgi:hypothetical protein
VFLRLITGLFARSIGILSESNYVVVAEMTNDPWRAIFVERFRTEISPFAPSAEARLAFGSQREYAVFSSGASDYYAMLARFETRLRTESNEEVIVKRVTSGHAAYVPDFDPPFLTDADFENPRALEQYQRQRPIGMQILFQFEVQDPKTSFFLNEEVLWRHDPAIDIGDWIPARVVGLNDDLTYNISTESNGMPRSMQFARNVRRGFLRRVDFDTDADAPPLFEVGANVLVPIVELLCWRQGTVLSRSEDDEDADEISYKVRLYTGHERVVTDMGTLMLPQMESIDEIDTPRLSMVTIGNAFKESLASVMPGDDFANLKLNEHAILKGMTMTAFWTGGNAVLIWSGEGRVDINLFLKEADEEAVSEFYDTFVEELPFMDTLARDQHPRGVGGVVNFGDELDDETPIWWSGIAKADKTD